MEIDKILVKALILKYEGEIAAAKANIQVYLKQSVGIGEHTDILSEIDKWLNSYSQAEENLVTLNKLCK